MNLRWSENSFKLNTQDNFSFCVACRQGMLTPTNARSPSIGVCICSSCRNIPFSNRSYFPYSHFWKSHYASVIYLLVHFTNVIVNVISSDELHEKQLMEKEAKQVLFDMFPERFNHSDYKKAGLDELMVILRECFKDIENKHGHHSADPESRIHALEKTLTHVHEDGSHHVHHRTKRGAGGDHTHIFQDEQKYAEHHILHELTHAFHLGSMVILTVLLVIVSIGCKVFTLCYTQRGSGSWLAERVVRDSSKSRHYAMVSIPEDASAIFKTTQPNKL